MAELKAFKGVRYASAGELAQLVCPPYDIISPEDQARLHALHPNNAIRLELPAVERRAGSAGPQDKTGAGSAGPQDKTGAGSAGPQNETGAGGDYARVAQVFGDWLDQGVLKTEDRDSLYIHRQDFRDGSGARRTVTGVLGALTLEASGPGAGVLPHERTMAGPVADRLALLRASPVNISPIYAIYKGSGSLGPYFDSLEDRPPSSRFVTGDHDLQRLWVISAPAELEMLSEALAVTPLVIADGHHRYETALAYRAEQGARPGGHDAILCLCVDADVEDVMVLPYHRALSSATPPETLRRRLERDWGATGVPDDEVTGALEASEAAHPFVFLLPGGPLLVEISASEAGRLLGGRAQAARALHVVVLHEGLLPRLFVEGATELRFMRDASDVAAMVDSGASDAGVLLRGLRPGQIVDAAQTGERMPEKASYFWPKALTGLVLRPL